MIQIWNPIICHKNMPDFKEVVEIWVAAAGLEPTTT